MIRLLCLLLGYIFGIIQSGFIVGKIKGIDVREYGSKNSGTTNVLRTLGFKYALIVFGGDALKCIIAVLLCALFFGGNYSDILRILQLYTCVGVIIGHNYPFYMGFKGGKGIAATAGFVISLCFQIPCGWQLVILGIIIFFGTCAITHYVSLSSIVLYLSIVIEIVIMGETGLLGFDKAVSRPMLTEYYLLVVFLFGLALWRHRTNIVRLFNHTERKTYLFAKPELDLKKKE